MTTVTMTRPAFRPASPLECQRVGGCSARTGLLAVITLALISGSALFFVWSRIQMVKEAYSISELTREIKGLTVEQERLKVEAAALRSPERIESIARTGLGMEFPRQAQIRSVEYQQPREAESPAVAVRRLDPGGD